MTRLHTLVEFTAEFLATDQFTLVFNVLKKTRTLDYYCRSHRGIDGGEEGEGEGGRGETFLQATFED